MDRSRQFMVRDDTTRFNGGLQLDSVRNASLVSR
jgi:hypothetical protein